MLICRRSGRYRLLERCGLVNSREYCNFPELPALTVCTTSSLAVILNSWSSSVIGAWCWVLHNILKKICGSFPLRVVICPIISDVLTTHPGTLRVKWMVACFFIDSVLLFRLMPLCIQCDKFCDLICAYFSCLITISRLFIYNMTFFGYVRETRMKMS